MHLALPLLQLIAVEEGNGRNDSFLYFPTALPIDEKQFALVDRPFLGVANCKCMDLPLSGLILFNEAVLYSI